jgi:hypothetical protein
MGKIFTFFIMLLLIVLLAGSGWLFMSELGKQNSIATSFAANVSKNVPNQSTQFYPNMRFPENRISYGVSDFCSRGKIADIDKAISILEEKTSLDFYEGSNPELQYLCSDIAPKPGTEGHFIAGEGGPTKVINGSNFAVILAAEVSLYKDTDCDTFNVALHETLHALGFDHNNDRNSVLYPVSECGQIFDDYLVNEINDLYKTPGLPDLSIEKINANKTGSYLNFDIIVSNVGLTDAGNVKLGIFSDSSKVKDFELNDMEIGTKKTLTVENLKVGSGKEVKFEVSYSGSEISMDNNRAVLTF